MKKFPSVSLIITTNNWPQALELTLLSVIEQKLIPDEIIIADNGSPENTKAVIDIHQPKFPVALKHIWLTNTNAEKTNVLNESVRQSSSEYIIQTGADTILHPYFIYDHLECATPHVICNGLQNSDQQKVITTNTDQQTLRVIKLFSHWHRRVKGIKNKISAKIILQNPV